MVTKKSAPNKSSLEGLSVSALRNTAPPKPMLQCTCIAQDIALGYVLRARAGDWRFCVLRDSDMLVT